MKIIVNGHLEPDHYLSQVPLSLLQRILKPEARLETIEIHLHVNAWLTDVGGSLAVKKGHGLNCRCIHGRCVLCRPFTTSQATTVIVNLLDRHLRMNIPFNTSSDNCIDKETLELTTNFKVHISHINQNEAFSECCKFVSSNLVHSITPKHSVRPFIRCWFIRTRTTTQFHFMNHPTCSLTNKSIPIHIILSFIELYIKSHYPTSISTTVEAKSVDSAITPTDNEETLSVNSEPTPNPLHVVTPLPNLSPAIPSKSHSHQLRKSQHRPLNPFLRRNTRRTIAQKTQLLLSGSSAKQTINYYDVSTRHIPGTTPKYSPMANIKFPTPQRQFTDTTRESLLSIYDDLCAFHLSLVCQDEFSMPRDSWEQWIDLSFEEDDGTYDRAFMCLIVIIMSSSTSDQQLSLLVPRLFFAGLTSATAVIDFVSLYGMNVLCSLLTSTGRFYQNAERITNAADHFIQNTTAGFLPTFRLSNSLHYLALATRQPTLSLLMHSKEWTVFRPISTLYDGPIILIGSPKLAEMDLNAQSTLSHGCPSINGVQSTLLLGRLDK